MSSQVVTDAARGRLEEQKRSAARDFLKSAVMPLIEDVLVKKFCQTMDVIAEDSKRIKSREEGLVEALEEIASWVAHPAATVAHKALAAHRKQQGSSHDRRGASSAGAPAVRAGHNPVER